MCCSSDLPQSRSRQWSLLAKSMVPPMCHPFHCPIHNSLSQFPLPSTLKPSPVWYELHFWLSPYQWISKQPWRINTVWPPLKLSSRTHDKDYIIIISFIFNLTKVKLQLKHEHQYYKGDIVLYISQHNAPSSSSGGDPTQIKVSVNTHLRNPIGASLLQNIWWFNWYSSKVIHQQTEGAFFFTMPLQC